MSKHITSPFGIIATIKEEYINNADIRKAFSYLITPLLHLNTIQDLSMWYNNISHMLQSRVQITASKTLFVWWTEENDRWIAWILYRSLRKVCVSVSISPTGIHLKNLFCSFLGEITHSALYSWLDDSDKCRVLRSRQIHGEWNYHCLLVRLQRQLALNFSYCALVVCLQTFKMPTVGTMQPRQTQTLFVTELLQSCLYSISLLVIFFGYYFLN